MKKLHGGNLDIDLIPGKDVPWPQDKCPWNVAEDVTTHRCAVKNVSICPYFRGIKYPDIVICKYKKK